MLASLRWSLRTAVAGLGCAVVLAAGAASPAPKSASPDAQRLVEWVQRTGDHRGRPFVVVDKRKARIFVFDDTGTLVGESPALLGATRGDHTVPGVGLRAQTGDVGSDERTTPAGRFDSQPGRNLEGEHIVWVDYASAFAIHRVRPGRSEAPRSSRLATRRLDDKRVSNGCVVVPPAFYEQVVQKVLGTRRSVVYVMPETRPLTELFTALEQQ